MEYPFCISLFLSDDQEVDKGYTKDERGLICLKRVSGKASESIDEECCTREQQKRCCEGVDRS